LHAHAAAQGVGVGMQVLAPGLSVRADKSALFILLKNLLENALGVAPAGSTVSLTAGRDFISVRDAGPGIDPAFMPFIYDRFWRAPGAQYEGTGLGLAICKEIATAHDWRLSAQNQTPGACLRIDFAAAPGLLATFG
jgi:signal transduction histidine kinase